MTPTTHWICLRQTSEVQSLGETSFVPSIGTDGISVLGQGGLLRSQSLVLIKGLGF